MIRRAGGTRLNGGGGMADITKVIDTKLSKSEFIELIIDDIEKRLDEELVVLEKQSKAQKELMKLSFSDVESLIDKTKIEVGIDDGEKTFGISLANTSTRGIPNNKLPKRFADASRAYKEIQEKTMVLYGKKRQLNERGGARMTALRMILEQSPDGKEVLRLLDAAKLRVSTKLLGDGKKK